MLDLIAEKLTMTPRISNQSSAMERGIELEGEALNACAMLYNEPIKTVGLVYLSDTRRVACSPDGLIGEDGGIEIKCMNTKTHVKWLLSGKLPKEHKAQVQGCMWVCNRQWWDFASYDPRIDRELFIVRVKRDEEYIERLKEYSDILVDAMDSKIEELEN